jgi:hypothetical protein
MAEEGDSLSAYIRKWIFVLSGKYIKVIRCIGYSTVLWGDTVSVARKGDLYLTRQVHQTGCVNQRDELGSRDVVLAEFGVYGEKSPDGRLDGEIKGRECGQFRRAAQFIQVRQSSMDHVSVSVLRVLVGSLGRFVIERRAIDVPRLTERLAAESQDRGLVDESLDDRHRLSRRREKLSPFLER